MNLMRHIGARNIEIGQVCLLLHLYRINLVMFILLGLVYYGLNLSVTSL